MADQSRTTRKIRQGKVDIDYDDSSLIVHYDMELVSALRETSLCSLLGISILNIVNKFLSKDIC